MTVVPEFPDAVSIQDVARRDYEAVLPPAEESSTFPWLNVKSWIPSARVSALDRALVIEVPGYENPSSSCFTFCGGDDPAEVARTLLSDPRMDKAAKWLPLIPQSVVHALPADEFECQEDIDSNDYVYSAHATKNAKGRNFKRFRKIVNSMNRNYGSALQFASLPINRDSLRNMLELGVKWLDESPYGIDPSSVDGIHTVDSNDIDYKTPTGHLGAAYSVQALRRCLHSLETDPPDPRVLMSGVHLDDELVAFSIDEIVTPSLAVRHFSYASHSVTWLSDFVHYKVVSTLSDLGVDWVNCAEDLGHPGLRRHKKQQQPARFVRKYDVWERGWIGWGWRRAASRLRSVSRTRILAIAETSIQPVC